MKKSWLIVVGVVIAGAAYAAGSVSLTKIGKIPDDGIYVFEDRGVRCYFACEERNTEYTCNTMAMSCLAIPK